MSRLGADAAELDAVAAELDRYAGMIDQSRLAIDGALARAPWSGPDAEAFRQRWRTVALRDLDGFRGELGDAARELRRQAHEQRAASSDTGKGAMLSGGIAGAAVGAVGRVARPQPMAAASWSGTAGNAGLELIKGGVTPVRLIGDSSQQARPGFWSLAAGKGRVATSASVLAAAGYAAAGVQGAFNRWDADAADGFTTGERLARSGAAGVGRGSAMYAGTKGGIKGGALLGMKLGAIGGPQGMVVGAVVGGVVGGIAGGLASTMAYDSAPGQALEGAILDAGGAVGQAASDALSAAGGAVVRTADEALSAVGGRVSDAADAVSGWFGR